MSDYFIKYKNLAIYYESNNKLSMYNKSITKVIHLQDDDFETLRLQRPYVNCVKIDLYEQLTSNNLKRTLPRHIRECIIDLPEVRSLIREDKINSILEK